MNKKQMIVVVYHKLINVQQVLGTIRGQWEEKISVIEIEFIQNILGIWATPKKPGRIYILRKHPGLDMLSDIECGMENEEDDESGL